MMNFHNFLNRWQTDSVNEEHMGASFDSCQRILHRMG